MTEEQIKLEIGKAVQPLIVKIHELEKEIIRLKIELAKQSASIGSLEEEKSK